MINDKISVSNHENILFLLLFNYQVKNNKTHIMNVK